MPLCLFVLAPNLKSLTYIEMILLEKRELNVENNRGREKLHGQRQVEFSESVGKVNPEQAMRFEEELI